MVLELGSTEKLKRNWISFRRVGVIDDILQRSVTGRLFRGKRGDGVACTRPPKPIRMVSIPAVGFVLVADFWPQQGSVSVGSLCSGEARGGCTVVHFRG